MANASSRDGPDPNEGRSTPTLLTVVNAAIRIQSIVALTATYANNPEAIYATGLLGVGLQVIAAYARARNR